MRPEFKTYQHQIVLNAHAMAQRLTEHEHVRWFRVEVESEESIHGHNAFASIERTVNARK